MLTRSTQLLWRMAASDPKLGAAYLQLGILYSQRTDFSRAISAYQKAIAVGLEESSPEGDETLDLLSMPLDPDLFRPFPDFMLGAAIVVYGDRANLLEQALSPRPAPSSAQP